MHASIPSLRKMTISFIACNRERCSPAQSPQGGFPSHFSKLSSFLVSSAQKRDVYSISQQSQKQKILTGAGRSVQDWHPAVEEEEGDGCGDKGSSVICGHISEPTLSWMFLPGFEWEPHEFLDYGFIQCLLCVGITIYWFSVQVQLRISSLSYKMTVRQARYKCTFYSSLLFKMEANVIRGLIWISTQ